MVFEVMLFSAATLMMGRLGTAPLAAHQIALNVPSITFMVPMGIGMAATIRVGLAAGAHNMTRVRRAGLTAMALGGAVMIVFAIAMALFAPTIAELYLPATPETAEALALTVLFLRVAAAFQLFDGLQVIGANALRGLKDARLPMLLAGGAYWLVGFPLALVRFRPALARAGYLAGTGLQPGGGCCLHVATLRVCDVPAAVEQGRCVRMACSNGTLLRGLACVEVRSCDGASRSHRHTEGLWTRQARDDPGVCGIADSNTHRSRLAFQQRSRVQAILPAAARGPGRGQGPAT